MAESKEVPITMGEKVGYAVGDMACGIIFSSVYMYLTIFYTDVFGISASVVGVIFLISRILDAVTDPLMGSIIDRNQFKDGKFRPYIKWGIIPFVVAIFLLFTVPPFPMVGKIIYAFVTYVLVILVYTVINIPYGALTSAMTRNQNQLISITSVRMYFANFASIVVAFGVPSLNEFFRENFDTARSYQLTMLILACLGAVLLFITYKSTHEYITLPKNAEKVKFSDIKMLFLTNRPLVVMCLLFVINFAIMTISGAAGAYYVTYNMGRPDLMKWFMLLGNVPSFVVMFFVPALVRKFGKKIVLYVSTLIYIAGLVGLFFVPVQYVPLVFGVKLLAATGACLSSGIPWALVPELIVYGEYKTGKRMGGLIYAIIGFFFKLGMALGGIILGFCLAMFKYVPNQTQSPESLQGILLLVTLVPALFLVISLYCIKKYELTEERYAEVVKAVEEKEAELNKKDN